jgi:hypothetical protein
MSGEELQVCSVILQIVALFSLSVAVFALTFTSIISRHGIEGIINRFLNFMKVNSPKRRERLLWVLILIGFISGVTGLIMELFI